MRGEELATQDTNEMSIAISSSTLVRGRGAACQGRAQPRERAGSISPKRRGLEKLRRIEQWYAQGLEHVGTGPKMASLAKCWEYLAKEGMDLSYYMGRQALLHGPFPVKGSRWYATVTVRGKDVMFLIDSGASVTVLSTWLYTTIAMEGDDLCMATRAQNSD